MSTELQQGIADILMPVAPADTQGLVIMSAAIIILTGILLFAGRSIYRSKRRVCLRNLENNIGPRIIAGDFYGSVYALAALIRKRTGINKLDQQVILPLSLRDENERWLQFTSILQAARYSGEITNTDETLRYLYSEAKFWLRKWP